MVLAKSKRKKFRDSDHHVDSAENPECSGQFPVRKWERKSVYKAFCPPPGMAAVFPVKFAASKPPAAFLTSATRILRTDSAANVVLMIVRGRSVAF